jgi:hypothetical protein
LRGAHDRRLVEIDELLNYPIPEAGERTSDFLLMTSACSNRIARTAEMTVTTRMPVVLRRMFRQMAVGSGVRVPASALRICRDFFTRP